MNDRWKKPLGLGIALLTLGALAIWAFRPAPIRVNVAKVERGLVRVTVDEEGETRVRDRFVVAAPLSGRLERIHLDAGDEVERDDVVARMYPQPLDPRVIAEAKARLDAAEAAKKEADARVERARAALEQARRAARRAQKLAGPGTISAEELELAELEETTRNKDLEAAVFAAHAADYNVQAAKAVLLAPGTDARAASEDVAVELHAPVSGHVLRIHEKSERVVAMGTPLIEIGNPSALEIVIDVLSTDAVKIKPGNRILIEGWGGEGNLEARVRLVEPSGFTKLSALGVEEKRVNVIADFSSPPGPLGDGYRLDARIVIWEAENVAKIPASALFRHDGDWSVFVVENGRAYRKPVRIGHRSAFEVEILEGLTEGESVITHPSDRVKDRVRVRDGG